MKKISLSLALSLVMSVAVFASDRTPAEQIRAKATEVTRVMAQQLRLNESEYIRLKALNQERFSQALQVAKQYKNDVEAKEAKLQEIEESFEKQLLGLLSASQLTAFIQFKEHPPVAYTALMIEQE